MVWIPDRRVAISAIRRRQRRRRQIAVAVAVLLVGLYLFSLGAAYEVGLAQSRVEVERLAADLALQRKVNRLMNERVATAEQAATRATRAQGELREQIAQHRTMSTEARALATRIDGKLELGVSAERLTAAITALRPERNCEPGLEEKRILLRTPLNREGSVADLGDGIFATRGSGQSARDAQGRPEAWFDPREAVEIVLEPRGDEARTLSGYLPIEYSVIRGDKEHILRADVSDRRGFVDISLQTCDYP